MSISCDVVLEQTLGHITHGQNLRRFLPEHHTLRPRFIPIDFEGQGRMRFVPGYSNWTVRAGLRSRSMIKALERSSGPPEVRFIHTQVPAMLLGRLLTEVPTIVSLDATPRQYDELGSHYGHSVHPDWLERAKARLATSCFERAVHLVTWAAWTKRALVSDYGIPEDRITVIPPGVDTTRWYRPGGVPRSGDGVVRMLFVGGDLRRKGGEHLIEAFSRLRARHGRHVELHLVTRSPVASRPGITIHSDLLPNSDRLIQLYHQADVFCLPTLGDCLPMVLPEAAAAGLAIVATSVGAISEIVRHGHTGLLVEVADVDGIEASLERLVLDHKLRRQLGDAASRLVREHHDAGRNASRLAELLISVADGAR